jgi:hypothetical protein
MPLTGPGGGHLGVAAFVGSYCGTVMRSSALAVKPTTKACTRAVGPTRTNTGTTFETTVPHLGGQRCPLPVE